MTSKESNPVCISVAHKIDSLPGVQQANNHTLERDMDCSFHICERGFSVGDENQAHSSSPSLPLFIHRSSELVTFQVQPLHYAWLVISIQVT